MVLLGLSTAKRNVKELYEIKVRKGLNWALKKVIKLWKFRKKGKYWESQGQPRLDLNYSNFSFTWKSQKLAAVILYWLGI